MVFHFFSHRVCFCVERDGGEGGGGGGREAGRQTYSVSTERMNFNFLDFVNISNTPVSGTPAKNLWRGRVEGCNLSCS